MNHSSIPVIRTYAIIEVTGFSLEHMSRLLAVDGKIESAPKNFSVYVSSIHLIYVWSALETHNRTVL